ncbi:MAG: putative replication protein [Noviherbaspirillum sp.]|nr:putative replication protein [Noviherbaspirillum sp.]
MTKIRAAERDAALQIKAPQALIHIKHKISLLQYKYWILLIRELRRQLDLGIPTDERGFRTIPMKDIAGAMGYTPNKTELWNDLLALKNETITFNFLGKDGGELRYGAGFISEWAVHATRIEFKFPSFIEDVVRGLDEPKAIFQRLNWEIFNHFSGKYEAIIYKLCRDYKGVGRTPYMALEKFREYMGIAPHEYKDFRDLNKVVISGPVKTINASAVSDISVAVEFEKQSRRVVGLRFTVSSRQQEIMPLEPEGNLAFRFAKVPLEPATQQKYLAMRTPEEIGIAIQRANEYGELQEAQGKPVTYGALYRKAITDGWHVQVMEREEQKKAVEKRKRAKEQAQREQEQAELAKNSEVADRINEAMAAFDALSEDRKADVRAGFRASLQAAALQKSFDRHGESAPMVRAQFAEYFLSIASDNFSEAGK